MAGFSVVTPPLKFPATVGALDGRRLAFLRPLDSRPLVTTGHVLDEASEDAPGRQRGR